MSIVQKFREKLFPPVKEKLIVNDEGEVISEVTDAGKETLDPTPMAPPLGFQPTDNIRDLIREAILAHEAQKAIAAEGFETEDEADDFDIPDAGDAPLLTPYEEHFFAQPGYDPGGFEGEYEPSREVPAPVADPERSNSEEPKPASDPKPAKPAKTASKEAE